MAVLLNPSKKVRILVFLLLTSSVLYAQWGRPFSDGFEEKLSVTKFSESWLSSYNGVMDTINTNCENVSGDRSNKVFFSLPSFLSWSNNSSYIKYFNPLLNIENIINEEWDESIIDKAKLVCLPNGRLVCLVLYINNTEDNIKISELLSRCSGYYTQKILMGWARQSNDNRTRTPIDAIGLLIVLQEGETNKIVSTIYNSIVYESINDSTMYYYNNNKGGYAIRHFENMTIKELREIDPENISQ
jgi:hypothetical protein